MLTDKLYRVVDDNNQPLCTGSSWNKKPRTYSTRGIAQAVATARNNNFLRETSPKFYHVQETEVEWHDVAE